ncbi:CoA ester lyase [Tessaracoccus sp. MC1679]|uniref:HpcH/HpaI aldolase/citrate lyase family protein n=1 Tax=Tessaracoccus sp. MC1679 TaxID=2760313 RepID=UPI0015FF51E7|nr:CoA ester lyase [Tessaracoccus sp. MC1679]MBB1517485.1 CoA ester lyase [Tessaracoccus sp. MC1679]
MNQRPARARRTVLSIPASSERFLDKSVGLDVDQVFLDLEDGVAAAAKDEARSRAVETLRARTWLAPTVSVRVNGWATPWTYRDVIDVVAGAGDRLDTVFLPKVTSPGQVEALDLLLTQLERAHGLAVGRIGIEVLLEDAVALTRADDIASASPRLEALHMGPGDLMASLGLPSLLVGGLSGGYPGDPLHHAYARILVAARARGLQAVDGPYVAVHDAAGFRASAGRAAALGYDGKWVLHPAQIAAGAEAFTPSPEALARAEAMVAAAARGAASGIGAVLLGDEMVDEAGVSLAQATLARGRRST